MVAQSRFRGHPTRESYSRESPGFLLGGSLPSGCKGGTVRVCLRRSCGAEKQTVGLATSRSVSGDTENGASTS